MNQHDQMQQMREALRLLQEIHPGNMTPMAEESWKAATVLIEQALAAERAPLVRLTEEEIASEYSKADAYLMMTDHYEFGLVAHAIMDAMDRANK